MSTTLRMLADFAQAIPSQGDFAAEGFTGDFFLLTGAGLCGLGFGRYFLFFDTFSIICTSLSIWQYSQIDKKMQIFLKVYPNVEKIERYHLICKEKVRIYMCKTSDTGNPLFELHAQ